MLNWLTEWQIARRRQQQQVKKWASVELLPIF